MNSSRIIAGLISLTHLCVLIVPAQAQIIDNSSPSQSASLGTWSQTDGGGDAWVEAPQGNTNTGLPYNVFRAVPAGASLGRTIKMGDLTNTYLPNGAQYFTVRTQSIQQLLSAQGRSANSVTVGDSPYTAGLTLGEIVEANGGVLPNAVAAQLTPQNTQIAAFAGIGANLAKTLSDNPVIKEIPLSELASGNFNGALDAGIQRGAQEAIKNLPAEWKNLPVGSIVGALASGNYQGALQQGLQFGGQRLAEEILSNPALKDLPIGALGQDLPLSSLGDIATKPLEALPNIGSQYISNIPGLKDSPVSQSPLAGVGLNELMAIAQGDLAVKLDIAYAGKKEQPSPNAFTGGTPNNTFTATNCLINSPKKGRGKTNNCGHFEMGLMNVSLNRGRYKGMQMVDGQTQQVKGGKGILAKVNGGWEPTGWKPFGDAKGYQPAKLSLKNINEHPGGNKRAVADIQLDLQICVKYFGVRSCTPHIIAISLPFKARQNEYLLLLASGPPSKIIQDAINGLSNRPDYCDIAAKAGATKGTESENLTPASPRTITVSTSVSSRTNQQQYLSRIAAGESGGGINLGALPGSGSNAPYGEYQFRGSTRQSVLNQYPTLDAWSSNKETRDKATLAWIGLYGSEIGVDILGSIERGDFATADRALGKNQFTSLPGGAEASPIWSNPANLAKYGAGGTAPNSPSGTPVDCSYATGTGTSQGAYTGPTSGTLMDPTLGKGPKTSGFGHRESPCAGCSSEHMGQDFGVPDGTPVGAAANGKIVFQGWLSGFGNTIFVDHGNGTMTQYSHLQEYVSHSGAEVKQGAVIALSGHSGRGTGPHLHFGVLQGTSNGNILSGSYVDPNRFLK